MATDRFPNQNVNMPHDPKAVQAARDRLVVGQGLPDQLPSQPANGKGSKREVRKGEWIDDRVINIGGPSSPSEDSPPELPSGRATPPATYDVTKVYQITLGKPAVFAGRMLSPAKLYQMTGEACTTISASIIDAVEVGVIPQDPDATPSATSDSKAKKKA